MGVRDLMVGVATMTSREIAELTGKNHGDVMRDIRNMLDHLEIDQSSFADIFFDSYGRPQNCFKLPHDETICLMTGYDPKARMAVIKRWKELETCAAAPVVVRAPTPAEMFLQSAQTLFGIEKEQAKQAVAIIAIESRVEQLSDAQLLHARPTNAENMGMIRARINKKHGLSASIIDQVMRQSLYAPKPAGMVKNGHENAQGGSYAVYWTKDITALFARFTAECAPTTATQYTHPLIDGKFKMSGGAA